jgi:hypothetical protein
MIPSRRSVQMAFALMAITVTVLSAQQSSNAEVERVRQRLIGSYKLVTYTTYDANGQEGKSAYTMGQISYDAAGRMAAHLMTDDFRKRAAEQRQESGQRGGGGRGQGQGQSGANTGGYLSYYGRYELDVKAGSVTHHVEGSSNLGFVGNALVRYYEITPDGKTLFLRTKAGERVTGKLQWDRY